MGSVTQDPLLSPTVLPQLGRSPHRTVLIYSSSSRERRWSTGSGRDTVGFALKPEEMIVSNKPPFSKQNLGCSPPHPRQKTLFELVFTGVAVAPVRTDRMIAQKVMQERCSRPALSS